MGAGIAEACLTHQRGGADYACLHLSPRLFPGWMKLAGNPVKTRRSGERMGGNHNAEADRRRDRDRELGKEGNVVDNLPTVVIRHGLNPAPHAVYLPTANSLTAP